MNVHHDHHYSISIRLTSIFVSVRSSKWDDSRSWSNLDRTLIIEKLVLRYSVSPFTDTIDKWPMMFSKL